MSEACRPLTLADVEMAAQVLAEAFHNDPLCAYMLPLEWTRRSTLMHFFRLVGELGIKNQRAFGAGEPLQCVAYWRAPGQSDLSISAKSIFKFIPLLFSYYPIGYLRARPVIKQIEDLRHEYAPEPHYYLDNLGVIPSAQGQGISSRLIRPFLDMADEQGVIAYTDTVTRANVGLYEHFGFTCAAERPVPGTGITVYALRRG